jgi:hypothetical protein
MKFPTAFSAGKTKTDYGTCGSIPRFAANDLLTLVYGTSSFRYGSYGSTIGLTAPAYAACLFRVFKEVL